MDLFISTGEDLQRELDQVPLCDSLSIQTDVQRLRDLWLEVRAGAMGGAEAGVRAGVRAEDMGEGRGCG